MLLMVLDHLVRLVAETAWISWAVAGLALLWFATRWPLIVLSVGFIQAAY